MVKFFRQMVVIHNWCLDFVILYSRLKGWEGPVIVISACSGLTLVDFSPCFQLSMWIDKVSKAPSLFLNMRQRTESSHMFKKYSVDAKPSDSSFSFWIPPLDYIQSMFNLVRFFRAYFLKCSFLVILPSMPPSSSSFLLLAPHFNEHCSLPEWA